MVVFLRVRYFKTLLKQEKSDCRLQSVAYILLTRLNYSHNAAFGNIVRTDLLLKNKD